MNNKFGMFIHFGIYSKTRFHEQAFAKLDMKREEYEGLKDSFCPDDGAVEEWVLLAKKAGMKYICFTAKHHDGFCMWDTKYTDYNIMNTPYAKDILKELSLACEKHGMLLSLYYSNPDWHHPYGYNPLSTHQDKAIIRDDVNTEIYREYIKNQLRELLGNYGKIYTLFWDIPPKIYDPSINLLARELQKDILINDRGFDEGDFSTPEREYTKTEGKRFSRMTEACNSLGTQSWGYRENEDFYSMRHLTFAIDKIMAMGGNYLLNVGPDEHGRVTLEYSSRLLKIGEWYEMVKESLEDNVECDFDYRFKNADPIVNMNNGKTYFHFPSGLSSSALVVTNYPEKPKRVRLLNTKEDLSYHTDFLPEYSSLDKIPLRISGIPIDKLENEAIVIEMEYNS